MLFTQSEPLFHHKNTAFQLQNEYIIRAERSLFPDFVIVSPKNLRQRVWRFSDALPSALFGYKPPCSKVA